MNARHDGNPPLTPAVERARAFVANGVVFRHDFYAARGHEEPVAGADLVVFPLAFTGDRAAVYQNPPAPYVLVHDWLWRRSRGGTVISPLLLKCLNLVRR